MTLTGTIIIICWIVLLIYWIVSAFFQKKPKEKSTLSNIFYSLALLISLILLLLSAKIFFLSYILIRFTVFINIISIFLSILGLIICVYSRTILGGNWSKNVVIKKDHELITSGLYKYVRHPIYLGLLMLFLGTAIAIGNLGCILGFVLLFFSFYIKLKEEENLMIEQFKEKYLDYMKRTKALIPFLF
jgi:protein-S-isoprenylcysteine O-methyltransferase Ste14